MNHSRSQIFPTRLIDVGELKSLQPPRLVKFESRKQFEKSKLPAKYYGYAALSYCWGSNYDKSCLLREENEAEFLQHLPAKIPRTIQESIDICKRLGIRYIWIDALCIIQGHNGNSSDWQNESARVSAYYHHAIVTIAAAWASRNDGGCLPVQWYATTRDHVKTCLSIGATLVSKNHRNPGWKLVQEDMDACILNDRGWALQELCMSTRLLWFTRTGIYWSCNKASKHSMWTYEWAFFLIPPNVKSIIPLQIPHLPKNRHNDWYGLMRYYSEMRLSFPSDRLPALSGLCKYVDPNSEDQYLAGIWKSSALQGLAWLVKHHVRPKSKSTALPHSGQKLLSASTEIPSWSFLSTSKVVGFVNSCFKIDDDLPSAEFNSTSVNLRYDDIHGEILSARICLNAVLVHLAGRVDTTGKSDDYSIMLSDLSIRKGRLHLAIENWDCWRNVSDLSWLHLDEDAHFKSDEIVDISALLLYVAVVGNPAIRQIVLLLIRTAKEAGAYRRVGLCVISLKRARLEALDKETLVRTKITLV